MNKQAAKKAKLLAKSEEYLDSFRPGTRTVTDLGNAMAMAYGAYTIKDINALIKRNKAASHR